MRIAAWNLQIFGQAKAANPALMAFYAKKMGAYDVVLVEEIRSESPQPFQRLCDSMPGYRCAISSRAGRTSSKEQYGLLWRESIQLLNLTDYAPSLQSQFERPPFRAALRIGNYTFDAIVIHTKPDDAAGEIQRLDALASPPPGNRLVLGDLNAGCAYYSRQKHHDFSNWAWLVPDGADTTSGPTVCAYDRLIASPGMAREFVQYGIDAQGINGSVSDHYLVWAEFTALDR